jgi:hypothetical protein
MDKILEKMSLQRRSISGQEKHTKIAALIINGTQVKTVRYRNLVLIMMTTILKLTSIGEEVHDLEPVHTVVWECKICSFYGKQKKIKIELTYDFTIPFWGIYTK